MALAIGKALGLALLRTRRAAPGGGPGPNDITLNDGSTVVTLNDGSTVVTTNAG